MPVYGRTFSLADPTKFDIGAEALGGGEAGRYTGESGFLSYYEICDFLHQDNTTLGMISHKKTLITIFGHQYFRHKFHQKIDIFHVKISTASNLGLYLV